MLLSAESIKTHSKLPYITNGAFVNLLKFQKLTYTTFAASKSDFV